MEEEPDDKDLQTRHGDHHDTLDDAEVEDPLLRAPYSAKVPVLPRPEVFLVAADRRKLPGQPEDGFLERRRLFWGCSLLRRQLGPLLVLNLHAAEILASSTS